MDEQKLLELQDELEVHKSNSELVLNPEFIPVDPKLLDDLGFLDAMLYGFIKFFLRNNRRFYCTNEQLAKMLRTSESSIKRSIKNLQDKNYINCKSYIKANWWKIRFIELLTFPKVQIDPSKSSDWPYIYNNITYNKKEDINTIDSNISLVPEKNKSGSPLKKDPSTDLSTLGPVPSEAKEFLSDSYNKYPSIRYQIDKQWDKYLVDTIKDRNKLCKEYGEETVKTVLNFIKQDDFRCKQIQSIWKLRKKNKDWVPYIVVIMDKITQYKPKIIDLDNM